MWLKSGSGLRATDINQLSLVPINSLQRTDFAKATADLFNEELIPLISTNY